MFDYYLKLAELPIKISAHHELPKELFKEFETKEKPVISVTADKWDTLDDEWLYLYKNLADQLSDYYRFVIHGAGVEVGGKGYLLIGPSGIGKSTRAKYLVDNKKATIINGDKPILWIKDNKIYLCSSPWAGKEYWFTNKIVELDSLIFVDRSGERKLEKAKADFEKVFSAVYLPPNKQKTLSLCKKLVENIDSYVWHGDYA